MVTSTDTRGVSEVLHDIFGNMQDIVRSEVRLVKTEVEEGVAKSYRPALLLAIGAMMGCFAVLFLLLASVFALSQIMPSWAAALVVALTLVVLCAIAVASGVGRFKQVRLASHNVASRKENDSWSKLQLS